MAKTERVINGLPYLATPGEGPWSSGYDVCLTRRSSPVRIRLGPLLSALFVEVRARSVSSNSFLPKNTCMAYSRFRWIAESASTFAANSFPGIEPVILPSTMVITVSAISPMRWSCVTMTTVLPNSSLSCLKSISI